MTRGVDEGERIFLDSDGYRERRELSLQRLALAAAREVGEAGQAHLSRAHDQLGAEGDPYNPQGRQHRGNEVRGRGTHQESCRLARYACPIFIGAREASGQGGVPKGASRLSEFAGIQVHSYYVLWTFALCLAVILTRRRMTGL